MLRRLYHRLDDVWFVAWFFLGFVTIVGIVFGFISVAYLGFTTKEAVVYMVQPFLIGVWFLYEAWGIKIRREELKKEKSNGAEN